MRNNDIPWEKPGGPSKNPVTEGGGWLRMSGTFA